jgi:L-rhamnose mutarotase
MQRMASIAELRPERVDEYRRLHADVWPGVLKILRAGHLHNYSIHLRPMADGRHLLFSYFEYTGSDFVADMAKIDANPEMQRWWEICQPCLSPPDGPDGQYFAELQEIFYME